MSFLNLFRRNQKDEINEVVYAAIDGTVVALEDVPDVVFSDKIIGDGLAIQPTSDLVVSPVVGTVTKLYDTRHAIMLNTTGGLDIFIHFGLNIAELKGEHLELQVKVGDKVVVGQPLLKVNLAEMERKGLITTTPVVVSNLNDKSLVDMVASGQEVKAGETIIYRVVSN